jgi:ankyrin repeat protein
LKFLHFLDVSAIVRKRRKRWALCKAIYTRNLEQVRALLDDGLEVNFARGGFSPLVSAVATEDRRIVDLLIQRGASLAGPGNDSFLVAAARNGDHELIDLAIAAGKDVHFRPAASPSPLQAAAFRNKSETMKYLIARGATKEDFDVRCRWTFIHTATINVLLELGVNVPDYMIEIVKAGKWL